MKFCKSIFSLCILFLFISENPLIGEEEGVQVKLVSESASVQVGKIFWVGIHFQLAPGWHIYWKNPGEVGMGTMVSWELPEGFKVGPLEWPVPKNLEQEGMQYYGYGGDVLLMAPIEVPEAVSEGDVINLKAYVRWLGCKSSCVPGFKEVVLALPVSLQESQKDLFWSEEFEKQRAFLPQNLEEWQVEPYFNQAKQAMSIQVRPKGEGIVVGRPYKEVYFYCEDEGVIDPTKKQGLTVKDESLLLALPLAEDSNNVLLESGEYLRGVLYNPEGWKSDGSVKGLVVEAPVKFSAKEGEAILSSSVEGEKALSLHLSLAILFAFVGGLILNLMPCVFPVLSIKILSFVKKGGDTSRVVKLHGLVFGLGVVISFWVLAGILVILRLGGAQIGWGFQLQSPYFTAFLCLLLVTLALNFLGVFEMGLRLSALGGRVNTKEAGYGSSFFAGVLATVLATPCTAPFMGAALGYALTQTIVDAFFIFTALGVGMALPYVALSFSPPLLKLLPKPGEWMNCFKQLMAFPLFATVIWLLWVFGSQVGLGALIKFLFSLLLLSAVCWVYGKFYTLNAAVGVKRSVLIVIIILLSGVFYLAYDSASSRSNWLIETTNKDWKPFSPSKLEELRAEGQAVFIDFTAAWCLTCQANKKNVLRTKKVMDAFKEKGVTLLYGDWTLKDPVITAALESYKRSGVPTYVFYPPIKDAEPILLPELLTKKMLLDLINKL